MKQEAELSTAPQPQPSALELRAIKMLGSIPGMRWLGPSRRVVTAMRGSIWTLMGYAASQLIKFASALTLARMLAPQAFGIVALVTVFLSGLEMLSDLGIGMDVVQSPRGADPVFINTAFIIQAARGGILWIIALALAYPFARFYHEPAVLSLLIVGSFSVLLRGLTSGSIWGLTRDVQASKYNFLTIGSDGFGFVVSLCWALMSPTAWALVVGRVASTLAFVVASHWIAEHPVTAAWDSQAARDILTFGSGIILGTGTYFLSGEAERLVIGKFVTLVELGCFALALSISSAAATGLQQIVVRVFFPIMSASLRENRAAAVAQYRKSKHVLCAMSGCLGIGFILCSQRFVLVVLGPKYAMAGWMLQLLGLRGALELITMHSVSMLFALGISKYGAIGNTFKLIFLAIGLAITFGRFGFREALWVVTVAPMAAYMPLLYGLRQHCREVFRTDVITFLSFLATISLATLVYKLAFQARVFQP